MNNGLRGPKITCQALQDKVNSESWVLLITGGNFHEVLMKPYLQES